MKKSVFVSLGFLLLAYTPWSQAENSNGKNIFVQRCAMCHGADIKGTGPLANKSNPPTPDLTTAAFKRRLNDYPGVIVSSVVLRPNGDLIPRTLRENGVKLPGFTWRVKDLRDLNEYMTAEISKKR
ncbi:MAG: cytochrome c [Comamonas sp.]|uniref:cytochrome c n=1 Tax=Comamonas sp. TaxID=34028 RepID=UPI003D0B6FFE